MSSAARRCSNCGATAARQASRFCEFCGTELPLPARVATSDTSPAATRSARFRTLEADPEYASLLAFRPDVRNPMSPTAMAGSVLVALFFVAVGLMMAVMVSTFFPPLAVFPLLVVGIALYGIGSAWTQSARFAKAPLASAPAIVLSTRTRITGGGKDTSSKTQYYATLEAPDGTRRELESLEEVMGTIAEGDIGVAYTKGPYLVEFQRAGA